VHRTKIRAAPRSEWANRHQIVTWGLTGYDGGELRTLASRNLHISIDDMGMAQSMHLLVFHWILDDLHARINSNGRYLNAQTAMVEQSLSTEVNAE